MLWLETKLTASVAVWRSRTEITHNILLKLIPLLALSLNSCLMTDWPPLQALEFFSLWLEVTSGNWKVKYTYMQSAHRHTRGLVHIKLCSLLIIQSTVYIMCPDFNSMLCSNWARDFSRGEWRSSFSEEILRLMVWPHYKITVIQWNLTLCLFQAAATLNKSCAYFSNTFRHFTQSMVMH